MVRRGGLTLYFEIPPEATGVSLRFEPEGIVREAEHRVSADGSELAVHFDAERRGEAVGSPAHGVEPVADAVEDARRRQTGHREHQRLTNTLKVLHHNAVPPYLI